MVLNNMRVVPFKVPPPTHALLFPAPATWQSPFSETAFKWVVVTGWMALVVSHRFPCVFYSICGEQPEVIKYQIGSVWP